MPLGFERLNERTTRPNSLINFIKPLPGPTSATAQDFLERVAAICYPIMKAHHIAVMALEEYEPNPEFVGRNFNAGEVIQLVLKGRRVGGGWQWLSFRSVQMVMMHELAHCKQMNHSRAFWKVRDSYAGDLRDLWARNYTGEGLWGRGRALENGAFMEDGVQAQLEEPKSLCGGTFRSSGRKRKRKGAGKEKEKLSYAERQQRRILRKFGTGGTAIGADEDAKVKLEAGKPSKGKPRVAKSARGRELRAAAALARFDQARTVDVKNEEEGSGSETDSDFDEVSPNEVAALDLDGKAMLDTRGHGLVKVCEGEDGDTEDARREMVELQELETPPLPHSSDRRQPSEKQAVKKERISSLDSQGLPASTKPRQTGAHTLRNPTKPKAAMREPPNESEPRPPTKTDFSAASVGSLEPTDRSTLCCWVCSFANDAANPTCAACANVLDLSRVPSYWRCQSLACREGCYVNAGDCGRCGACGASKPVGRVELF